MAKSNFEKVESVVDGCVIKLQVIVSAKKQTPVKCPSLPWPRTCKSEEHPVWNCTDWLIYDKNHRVLKINFVVSNWNQRVCSGFSCTKEEDAIKTACFLHTGKQTASRDNARRLKEFLSKFFLGLLKISFWLLLSDDTLVHEDPHYRKFHFRGLRSGAHERTKTRCA